MTKIYQGKLFSWFETGMEGFVWALQDDSFSGYDGLIILKEGDRLRITNTQDEIVFDGVIDPDNKIGLQRRPSGVWQPTALGCWIHWTQKGFDPDEWAGLFVDEKFIGKIVRP